MNVQTGRTYARIYASTQNLDTTVLALMDLCFHPIFIRAKVKLLILIILLKTNGTVYFELSLYAVFVLETEIYGIV